jgi:hypothetical protein
MIRISSARRLGTIRIAMLTAAALASANTVALAGPVTKFTNEGGYASVGGSDGCLLFFLEVSRYGAHTTQQTFLYYEVYDVCVGQSVAYGSGTIPNSALVVNKNKNTTLSVAVATTSTFFTSGTTGNISLTFAPDTTFEHTFSGHSTTAYPNRVIRWHGSWTYTAAIVSGTLITANVTSPSGQIGQGRGREILIEHSAK